MGTERGRKISEEMEREGRRALGMADRQRSSAAAIGGRVDSGRIGGRERTAGAAAAVGKLADRMW